MIQPRNIINDLKAYVPGKPAEDVMNEYNLTEVIKLASNENPLGCSKKAIEAVKEALLTPGLYPDGNGTKLKNKISNKYSVNDKQIILGAGSDELITLIAKTYIEQGDEAISAELTFPQYKSAVLSMNGTFVGIKNKAFGYDLDGIIEAINDRTKVIYIANPNNPTGTMLKKQEIEAFMKKVPETVLVVFDEAYNEYIDDSDFPDTLSLMKTYKNIILLRTFSKMYGLASFRIGYGIATENIIDSINRIRNPFNVSTYAQVAATAAIDDLEFIKESYEMNKASKEYTYKRSEEMGLHYVPSSCNFVLVDCKKNSSDLFIEMQKRGVILRPVMHPDTMTYMRISLGTTQQMKKCFDILEELL